MGSVFGKKKKNKYNAKSGGDKPKASPKKTPSKKPKSSKDEISKFELSSDEEGDADLRKTPSQPPVQGRNKQNKRGTRPPPVKVHNVESTVHVDSPAAAQHMENLADAVMANHVASRADHLSVGPDTAKRGSFKIKSSSAFETLAVSQELENDYYWGDTRQDDGTLPKNPNSLRLDLDPQTVPGGRHGSARDLEDTFAQEDQVDWQRGELLGQGSFGKVYLGLELGSGQMLAVKQVEYNPKDRQLSEDVASLILEVKILQKLEHPNIVRYLGINREADAGLLNIFLEYVPGGSIAQLLSKFGKFQESVLRVYTRQILEGLHYLHVNRIIHRDIKGANILVDDKGTIKLADFGASKKLAGLVTMSTGLTSMRGSPYWMAPEVIKQTGYGRQADIWSLGCTVIEMASGIPPWTKYTSQVAALYHIASTDEMPEIPTGLSPEGVHFLTQCFHRDPQKRPTAAQLLKHPFVAQAIRKGGAFSERLRGAAHASGSVPYERGVHNTSPQNVGGLSPVPEKNTSPTRGTPPRSPLADHKGSTSASPFTRDHHPASGHRGVGDYSGTPPPNGRTPPPKGPSYPRSAGAGGSSGSMRYDFGSRRGSSADSAAIAAYLTVKVEKDRSRNISQMIRHSVGEVDRDRRTGPTLGLLSPVKGGDSKNYAVLERELEAQQRNQANGLGSRSNQTSLRAEKGSYLMTPEQARNSPSHGNLREAGATLPMDTLSSSMSVPPDFGKTLKNRRHGAPLSVNVTPTGSSSSLQRKNGHLSGTLTPDSAGYRNSRRRRSDVGLIAAESPQWNHMSPKVMIGQGRKSADTSPPSYVPTTPSDAPPRRRASIVGSLVPNS